MNKKNLFLIGLVLVLAGVYAVYFTDWFQTRTIAVFSTQVGARMGARTGARVGARTGARTGTPANTLFFGLDDYYELTEIKVVPLAALQTNALAQPVWHLVGDPSSDSIKSFNYGAPIEGMVPAVTGLQPEPLEPGVIYRIFVTDGKLKGQHDFHLGAAPANTSTNKNRIH
jgi:hypothetical protein